MNGDDQQPFDAHVRVMQIVRGALIMGALTFLGVVLYLGQTNAVEPVEGLSILPVIAVVFLGTGLAGAYAVPRLIVRQTVERLASGRPWPAQPTDDLGRPVELTPERRAFLESETGRLLALCQTIGIIQGALFEGPTFLGLVTYLLTGHWLGLTVAGVGLALLVVTFPTAGRVQSWVEARKEELAARRERGDLG